MNRLCFLLALPVLPADRGDWANLQTLHRGDKIGVVQTDQRRIEGRFDSASGSTLAIESNGLVTLSQNQVLRVYKQAGMSRKKKMLIGSAVGLAAGAAVGASVARRLNNEGLFSGAGAGAGAAAGGAGIGLAIGGLSGNGYQTVYQRKEVND